MLTADALDHLVTQTASAHMPTRRLRRVAVEPYINSIDEEGLRVTIVLADDDPAPVSGEMLLDTLLALTDALGEAGDARSPTLYFATEEELSHSGDPDD